MENTINERIKAILHQSKYRSIRSFAERIDVAPTSLNGVINGAEPRYSTLYKILSVEPSISAEWLIRFYTKVRQKQADIAVRRVIDYALNPSQFQEYIDLRMQVMMGLVV